MIRISFENPILLEEELKEITEDDLSWYLFVPLTPPGSEILALQYANKAYELNPLQKYADHIEFVKSGN